MRAGRAWSGSLTGFRGNLDLSADGACPMGSASVSSLDQRQVLVSAGGLPSGGSLQVVQGSVDYAGTAVPAPRNTVIATFSDIELAAGSLLLPVDTTTSSYVRAQVRDAGGTVVGLSNPIWLLRETPPKGIPAARLC